MQPRNLIRAFLALWWTLGVLLCWYSVRTVIGTVSSPEAAANSHIVVLASLESIAAILFLVPRTMRLGGISLLAIFAVAFVIHAMHGEFASQLLLYSVAVLFVVAHGAHPLPQLFAHPASDAAP